LEPRWIMPETRLFTVDVGRRGHVHGKGLDQPVPMASGPQTRLGGGTTQPSLIIARASKPRIVVAADDDGTVAEIERLLRGLQAGRRCSPVSQAASRMESVRARGHSWGQGWGRRGATHRWGTYD